MKALGLSSTLSIAVFWAVFSCSCVFSVSKALPSLSPQVAERLPSDFFDESKVARFIAKLLHSHLSKSETSSDWNYLQQGDDWGSLCRYGTMQSPVNIFMDENVMASTSSVRFSYNVSAVPLTVTNNGHGLEVAADGSSDSSSLGHINFDGKQYNVLQYHFHAPAEHTFGESHIRYPLELHVVHKHSDDDLAVLAVFFSDEACENDGNESPSSSSNSPTSMTSPPCISSSFFDGFLESEGFPPSPHEVLHLPETESFLLPLSLDILQHLSSNATSEDGLTLVNYSGSLTTPPCAEIVQWLIHPHPFRIDQKSQEVIAEAMRYPGEDGNYRNEQRQGIRPSLVEILV